MNARHALIAILGASVPLAGCQTMRPVDLSGSEALIAKVAPNDFVRVWLRDGRTIDLHLTAVETDTLVSGEQRIPLKDIERVERREISWTRTALLLVRVGVVTFVVAAATAVKTVSSAWH
jgi:hypothetical protein